MKALKLIAISLAVMGFTALVALYSCGGDKIEVTGDTVSSATNNKKPALNVFIENSGSMDGYMVNGSQLKDCVYDYVSELNAETETTNLYYINSKIIPFKGDLQSYIKTMTPAAFKQAGGNRSNTDLGQVIGDVLKTVSDSTVSIFISDCILDIASKDASKFLRLTEITLKNEIINVKKRVPNLGVEILKLNSDFTGKYFYPDGRVEMLNNVKRPYYMWIFGDKNFLAKINKEVPFSSLTKYDLKGIASFANLSSLPYDVKNQNGTSSVIIPAHGDYHVMLRADFGATLQPDGVVQDKSNYAFNNNTLIIDGVYPISDKKSKYTHFVKFTIPKGTKISQEQLTFISPKMPT